MSTFLFCFVNLFFFKLAVGIHMGTKYTPLSVHLLLYSYKADFMQGILKNNEKISGS